MTATSIQDRTAEFRAVLAQAQKRHSSTKAGSQRQSLLTESQRRAANGSPNGDIKGPRKGARSDFARRAAEIGRGITGTMEKLGRLAECMWICSLHTRLVTRMALGCCGSSFELMDCYSGEKEDTLRRPACGNQRAYIRNKARPFVAELSNILTTIIIKVTTITVRTRWRRAGRGT